jgi:hypothetical protein
MPINELWFNEMWGHDDDGDGASGTMTINLPRPTYTCGTVALTRVANYDDFSFAQVYFIGYSVNGNPIPVSGSPTYLIISDATSFTVQADLTDGAMTAQMTLFMF